MSDDEPLYDAVADDMNDYGQVVVPAVAAAAQQVKFLRSLKNTNSID